MPFENLPGIFDTKLDGNLTIPVTNDSPIVCVIGTAAQGASEELFSVVRPTDAARVFGKSGSLIRGMYESVSTGATNVRLFRIGATAGILSDLTMGVSIETSAKDDSVGADYKIWYTASSGRLRVYTTLDDTLIFDTGDGTQDSRVDLGLITVDGTPSGGSNIGTSILTAVALEDVPTVDMASSWTAGTDGLELTRMEMYQALDRAYSLLEDADLDIVLPQNVYLDDKNVMDMTAATASGLLTAITGFDDITVGGPLDVLGLLYTEEYNGEKYYFWDLDRDGVAEIVPTVRGLDNTQQTALNAGNKSIAAIVSSSSTNLTLADFHEVNFAYQLANFCFRSSHLNEEMHGSIGVLPPASFSSRDVSLWVGSSPVTAVDGDGIEYIVTNGTGLLGNKWVAGRKAVGTLPGHIIDGVASPGGGFIATDDGWINGIQLKDDNDKLVDIGKYLDLVSAYVQMVTPARDRAYVATAAAVYAGLISTLVPASAPTNKIVSNVSLPFRMNASKLDALAGKKFVPFVQKQKGVVVADAPTAARKESDYTRRSTMRIVKACLDVIRIVGEPFLGEGMSGAQLTALETAIQQSLSELVKGKVIIRYDVRVTATALERVQGRCQVQLVLVPAFELRQINVEVALASS